MKKLISILALPRSGTTLLTAILDSHPEVECWYEVFGSRKDKILPVYKNFNELYTGYLESIGEGEFIPLKLIHQLFPFLKRGNNIPVEYPFNYFVLKEVNTFPEGIQKISGIEYVDSILRNVSRRDKIPVVNIWIHRNFRHAYFSKIEGFRKWWGDPDFESTKMTYIGWINEAYCGIKLIQEVSLKYPTVCVSYESLVCDYEKTIRELLDILEIPFSENVLHYNNFININKVNGDLNLTHNPELPKPDSIYKRENEWREFSKNIYPLPPNSERKEKYLINFYKGISKNPIMKLTKEYI